jgi:hypothetical protein
VDIQQKTRCLDMIHFYTLLMNSTKHMSILDSSLWKSSLMFSIQIAIYCKNHIQSAYPHILHLKMEISCSQLCSVWYTTHAQPYCTLCFLEHY